MPHPAPTPWMALVPWAETLAIACVFLWGAMLGSFLNVVAYRVPRGESVVWGRSRCPACGAAVRPRDNVPILGWLLLRGRCRDCEAPIAARYPLVEAGCGLLLVAVAVMDFFPAGFDQVLLLADWMPLARFGFHAAAALALVSWGLLAACGRPVSRVSTIVAVILAGMAAVSVPGVQPLGVLPDGLAWPSGRPRLAALASWAAGMAAGWAVRDRFPVRAHAMLLLLGATLGWQIVLAVTVVMAVRPIRRPSADSPDLGP